MTNGYSVRPSQAEIIRTHVYETLVYLLELRPLGCFTCVVRNNYCRVDNLTVSQKLLQVWYLCVCVCIDGMFQIYV